MISTRRIVRLPQVVADSIAAGEVVERPASVVKELIENALDAGARHVQVHLDGGGLIRIEVVDDGDGIADHELELAVARHATSKITSADDLHAVQTLGFRGEALASIAAVSDLKLVSRERGADAGATVHVRGGEVFERGHAGAAVGTRVEVCELFATTPARLRFLRSASAETAAAVRVVSELALLHHDTAFAMKCDDRETLRTAGGSLRDAARAVYGPRARDMLDIAFEGPITVRGAVSAPHAHRGQRGGVVLAVNGRRIVHRGLQVAVDEAYRGLIPTGRFPFGVVMVLLDPGDVDVNVHPAKREVRFRDDRRVFAAVQRACWAVLQTSPVATPPPLTWSTTTSSTPASTLQLADERVPFIAADGSHDERSASTLAQLAPLHALGQAGDSWIVAASGDDVVIVDPHAAHEKSLYMD
ncbi:MAG: DNA mismatch repair endonuclease MutL, partial [Candidatus Dormibacteria bacterium]